MKKVHKPTYAGYITLHRALQHLLTDGTLNINQFAYYILFIFQAHYFKNADTYSYLIRDDSELAKAWKCDKSTVNRRKNELIKLGFLIKEDGIVKVPNFMLFEQTSVQRIVKLLPNPLISTLFSKSNKEIADVLSVYADLHQD